MNSSSLPLLVWATVLKLSASSRAENPYSNNSTGTSAVASSGSTLTAVCDMTIKTLASCEKHHNRCSLGSEAQRRRGKRCTNWRRNVRLGRKPWQGRDTALELALLNQQSEFETRTTQCTRRVSVNNRPTSHLYCLASAPSRFPLHPSGSVTHPGATQNAVACFHVIRWQVSLASNVN